MEYLLPAKLTEIIEDFKLCEGREKIELLIEFSESLPDLPQNIIHNHDHMDQVHECMTPVFVQSEIQDGCMFFHFDVPAESPTVRGYASIMKQGLDGSTPEDILRIPGDFFHEMGLHELLTHQRLNGLSAILAHLKQLAVKELDA